MRTADGRRETPKAPEIWLDKVERVGSGEAVREALRADDQATELVLMGLRLNEGIDLDRYSAIAGREIDALRLDRLQEIGVLWRAGGRIGATRSGRPVLNAILRDLLA